MSKLLVLPDIHGRKFWEEPCQNIESFDKVVFLGDYLDPYDFEGISVQDAIDNFKEIIDLKKRHKDKIILLLGNHDMPYFSNTYLGFSLWHCRHSVMHHSEIHKLFKNNSDLFQIAYVHDDILFTHAGVESGWLYKVVECDTKKDINGICSTLNSLTDSNDGLKLLYCITSERGGRDRYGSCIWSDIHDIMWDNLSPTDENNVVYPIHKIKQVFGHTLQAFYDDNRNIVFGDAEEFGNCKMLDTTNAYVLDTENYKIEKI